MVTSWKPKTVEVSLFSAFPGGDYTHMECYGFLWDTIVNVCKGLSLKYQSY